MTTHRRTFEGVPMELGAARSWFRKLLDGHPCADDAELIVTELAANAIHHTASGARAGTFHVAITLTERRLMVSVTDEGSPRAPQVQHASADSITGRGLDIVQTLAHQVAIIGDDQGRTVTAELQLPHQDTTAR